MARGGVLGKAIGSAVLSSTQYSLLPTTAPLPLREDELQGPDVGLGPRLALVNEM